VGNGSPVGLIVQAVFSFQRVIRVSFQCVIWVGFDKSPQSGIPQQQFCFNASNSLVWRAAGVCEVGYALPLGTAGAPQEPVAHTPVQVCPGLVWCVGFSDLQLLSALWAVILSMEAVPTIWVKVWCWFLRPGYEQ
jgi:hypothetical protein